MKPETRTVTELFGRDVRYVVPLYQRPYVWTEERQWNPLWDDVATLLDQQDLAGSSELYSHFLGALVLQQVTQAPGSIPVYTIIDGQQRLTTLQILLAAASNVAAKLGEKRIAASIRELVTNSPNLASGSELLKVWPTNTNRVAFGAVMADGGPDTNRGDDPKNRIDEAYAFFHRKVQEWAMESTGSDLSARFAQLRVAICGLLKVVSITLERDDNAQVIFETLNNRGTPLLDLDLVKNAVFQEATRQQLETDRIYEEVWRPELDLSYWSKPRTQGRLYRPSADVFLMYWLIMKLRQVTPATGLFNTFRDRILEKTPPPVTNLIVELCNDAKIMRSFDHFEAHSMEATFFRRLEVLDTATVLSLVLLLFREKVVSPDRRRRALQILESWLVRRMLMGYSTKNYNQQIPVLLGRVAANLERADEIILEELSAGTTVINIWPNDHVLRDRFHDRDLYSWISQARIAMVLGAVEESLHDGQVEVLQVPAGLSIEHIMPQSWEAHWPVDSALSPEEGEAAHAGRNSHVHLLGNLTLTAGKLNSALSNSAWGTKQPKLNEKTVLLLNTRLIEAYSNCFDEKAIDARGEILADSIVKIWPGPGSW